MGDEGIVLTDREREALAGLAESIGDPWLAQQLAGGDQPRTGGRVPRGSRPPKHRLAGLTGLAATLLRLTSGWVGALFLVAGAVLTLATFVASTGVASLGLLMMGFGAWRLVVDHFGDLILRGKAAAETRKPRATGPLPRRRPGAE